MQSSKWINWIGWNNFNSAIICTSCLLYFIVNLSRSINETTAGGAVASWLVRSPPEWAVRFEPWPGTLCCVLGQDTLLSQCPSPPRCINGYQRIVGETWQNCGGVEILPATSCYRIRDKIQQLWWFQGFTFQWNCFYNKDILTFTVHWGAFATYMLAAQKSMFLLHGC